MSQRSEYKIPQPVRFTTTLVALFAQMLFLIGPAIPSLIPTAKAEEVQAPAPTLTTDKEFYAPDETVHVSGSGFDNLSNILIKVIRPDGSVVTGDGSNGTWPTSYDTVYPNSGSIQYFYVLSGLPGDYSVQAIDPESLAVLASVTFQDAIGYNKGVYRTDQGKWTAGNAGSAYQENEWAFYQYQITGINLTSATTNVPNFNVVFNHYQVGSNAIFIDAFTNFRACLDSCGGLVGGLLPDGTNRPPTSTAVWKEFTPSNINALYSGSTCSGTDAMNTPSADHCFSVVGSSLASLVEVPATGTHTITFYYEAHLAASFTWLGGHQADLNNTSSIYYVNPHPDVRPVGVVHGTNAYSGWNASFNGLGAATGSSRNFKLQDQTLGPNGAITLPIPAVETPAGQITVTKVTSPTSANGVTFSYTGDLGSFNLDTDGGTATPNSTTVTLLPPGSYDVTEGNTANWSLTNLVCTNSTGSSTFNYVGSTATINLVQGGAVVCTYTNTRNQGTSSVVTELHKADHSVVNVGDAVPLGTIMHDKATVSVTPNFGPPTGNVTFRFYTSLADCQNDTNFSAGTEMGTVALDGSNPGVAHPSTATSALTPGTYAFKARYAGDSTYTPNTSSCENFTVNQDTSSVATELHKADHSAVADNGHVALGTIMHDRATVTVVGPFNPTGNVSFELFTTNNCTGGNAPMGLVALTNTNPGVAHPSLETSALAAGDYSFKATWAGDSNYSGNVSSCEPFVVDKAQLTVTTSVHNEVDSDITSGNVPLGSVVHDTATVTGAVSGFTAPTPTFTLTSSYIGTCAAGAAVANDGTESVGVYKAADSVALGAGAYAYRGAVVGNDNYIGDESPCEPFTVDKAQLTVTTIVHDVLHGIVADGAHIALGSSVHDTADVTGGISGFPVPTPTFTWTNDYTNSCAQGAPVANDGTDISGDDRSVTSGALQAGSYAYRGAVAGNANYEGDVSGCEPFIVDKADSSVVTQVHNTAHGDITDTAIALGSTVHDSATVNGQVGSIAMTGDVTYDFYVGPNCDGTLDDTETVGLGTESSTTDPLAAGSYYYIANYSGDDNYDASTGICEPFTVNKDNLTILTDIHDAAEAVVTSVPLGMTVHDQANITSLTLGFDPSQPVDFTFYTNNTCQDGTASGSAAIVAGVAHSSDSQGPLGAGLYSFKANYVGDGNYNSAIGPCEPLTVNKSQLNITTDVHNADHDTILNDSTPLGSVVHDTADITGAVDGFPIPAVSFTMTSGYNGQDCSQGAVVANDDTESASYKSADSPSLTAGSYAYRATVDGDANYIGDTGECEPFTVSQGTTTVTTQLHQADETPLAVGGSVEVGANIHDQATVDVSGPFNPTGPVRFRFYTNNSCTGDLTAKGQIALTDADPAIAHPSLSSGVLNTAGQYSFSGNWNGDVNYPGQASDCENFNVVDASIALSPQEASNKINDPHTITAHVTMNDGTGLDDAEGVTVDFTIAPGSATFVGDDFCVTDSNGECSITIVSSTTGSNTINATTTFSVGGVSLTRATDGDFGPDGTGAATKNYVNARISISPLTDTNPVNQEHVMTVTVEQNTSGTWDPVVGAIVNAIVSPSTTIDKTDCLAGTDTSGQCDVKINSATPGVFTTYARSTITVDGVEFKLQTNGVGDNSGPAVKTYVDVTVTTVIHKQGDETTNYDLNASVNGGILPLGSIVHDNATVTPSSGTITPIGTVTYMMFTGSTCDGAVVSVETVANGTESSNSAALTPGDYSYLAHFDGSYPYPAKNAACERLHVNQGTSSTSTELHEDSTHAVIALGGESVTGNVHDQATVTGTPVFVTPTGTATFRFYTTQAACTQDENFSGGVTKGTVALDGSGVAHPSDATGALAAGNYAFKAQYSGDTNYTGSTSGCENFTVSTLTINKLANGDNDTFGYTVTGPTNASPSVTTTGTPGIGSTTIVVQSGSYRVGETTIPSGWQLVGLTCAGGQTELGPTSSPFNIPVGTNQVCDFENTFAGATRTQGFWSTHTAFANDTWTNDVPASEKNVNLWAASGCTTNKFIDATAAAGQNELMGGFWASIPKTSSGAKRTAIDSARMSLLQQLLAAELNRYGIGTNDGGLIAAGKAAFCGSNQNTINQAKGNLDTWNNSGDNVPLSLTVPSATPALSKTQANIVFWNNPTN